MECVERVIPRGWAGEDPRSDPAPVSPAAVLPVVLLITQDQEFARDMRAVLSGLARIRRFPCVGAAVAEILGQRHSSLWVDLDPASQAGTGWTDEDLTILTALLARCGSRTGVVVLCSEPRPGLGDRLASLQSVTWLTKEADLPALRRAIGRPWAAGAAPHAGEGRHGAC